VIEGKCATNKGSISKAFEQFEGREITITIEKKRRKRSNNQNSYLWGCVYPLVKMQFYETCGEVFTIEEVHEIMKMKFNSIVLANEETGEVIIHQKARLKTASLNKSNIMSR